MGLLLWAEKGNVEIPSLIETHYYDPKSGSAIFNFLVHVSNVGENEALVGAINPKQVQVVPSLQRWRNICSGQEDDVIASLCRFYKIWGLDELLASPDIKFGVMPGQDRPYTPFAFGPFHPLTDTLYSFDVIVGALDDYISGFSSHTIVGLINLKRAIKIEDIESIEDDYIYAGWLKLFNEKVHEGNLLVPNRYNVVIVQSQGVLATYRLDANSFREYVLPPELREKAAVYNIKDPLDFFIEVELAPVKKLEKV